MEAGANNSITTIRREETAVTPENFDLIWTKLQDMEAQHETSGAPVEINVSPTPTDNLVPIRDIPPFEIRNASYGEPISEIANRGARLEIWSWPQDAGRFEVEAIVLHSFTPDRDSGSDLVIGYKTGTPQITTIRAAVPDSNPDERWLLIDSSPATSLVPRSNPDALPLPLAAHEKFENELKKNKLGILVEIKGNHPNQIISVEVSDFRNPHGRQKNLTQEEQNELAENTMADILRALSI